MAENSGWPVRGPLAVLILSALVALQGCTSSPTNKAIPLPTPAANQFITISPNGKYLENSITGKPVFLTGDTPQLLAVQVSDSDVDTYL